MVKSGNAWALALLLSACAAIPDPAERQFRADALAAAKDWQSGRILAGPFDLVAYAPRVITPAETLTIYIEGDGFSWVTRTLPSTDPTPREPLALQLALAQPAGNAAYLARPCQYANAERSGCPWRYWTDARSAEEVVVAENTALDVLKQRFGARDLVLVGYSGGGAVAALLAARRSDVMRLVTVAGNLDHRAWTSHHRIGPLSESLNAADFAGRLEKLPQTHFVGANDKVISPDLARTWPTGIAGAHGANLRIISDADHACCWNELWPALMKNIHP